MDKKVISCEFNIDTACVEVKFADGSMIAIDCTLVETEIARNMYESSELEWLVYNAPVDYACWCVNKLRGPSKVRMKKAKKSLTLPFRGDDRILLDKNIRRFDYG